MLILKTFFPIIRNHWVGAIAQFVAELILSESDWEINDTNSVCVCTIENKNYKIKFWIANRMYAFFSEGEVFDKRTGKKISWKDQLPRRQTAWKILNFLVEFGVIEKTGTGSDKEKIKKFLSKQCALPTRKDEGMKKYVYEGEIIPFGYGFCYMEYDRLARVFYPFPINWIIRYARVLWWKIRSPETKWFEWEFIEYVGFFTGGVGGGRQTSMTKTHIATAICGACNQKITSLHGGHFVSCECRESFLDQERWDGRYVRCGGEAKFIEQVCPENCKVHGKKEDSSK